MRLDDQDPAPTRVRRCGKCRGSLPKLPQVGRCPACGESFGIDQDPFDHVCLGCRYDLTGLAASANCPECGLPIERSMLGDSLIHSPRAYVRAIRLGAGIALAGALVWIACPFAGAIVLACIYAPEPDASPYFLPILFASLGAIPLGLVLAIVGLWRMSVPDPLLVIRERGNRARQSLRYSLALAVALGLLQVLFALGLMFSYNLLSNYTVQVLAKLILIASIAVVMISAASYSGWIARRIGDPRLENNARSLRIAGGVVGAISAMAWMSCPCVGLLSLPLTLAMLVLHAEVLVRLRRQLGDILRSPELTSAAAAHCPPVSQAPLDGSPDQPPP